MSTRVYQFGLLAPTENVAEVEHQIRLAWEYRRALTKGPLKKLRDRIRRLQGSPETTAAKKVYKRIKAERDALQKDLSESRQKTRTRSESAEVDSALRAARVELKAAASTLRVARGKSLSANKADLDRVNTAYTDESCAERGKAIEQGLYWGAYQLVEEDVAKARKTPFWSPKDSLEEHDPRVPAWCGEGRVAIQIQKGMLASALFQGINPYAKIVLEPDNFAEKHMSLLHGHRRKRGGGHDRPQYGTLWIRVGSEGRDPVWAKWPIKLHRQIPKAAVIKRITISYYRVGASRHVWKANITVDEPRAAVEHCGKGAVAVDIGWRVQEDQLRSVYWRDTRGQSGHLSLSPELRSMFAEADKIRGTRDENLDRMKAQFIPGRLPRWVRAATVCKTDLMPSVAQARNYLKQRKSFRSWARLATDPRWKGECPQVLTDWYVQDRHLYDWEANQRCKALNRRRDEVRVFAATLTRTYATVILEANRAETDLMDLRFAVRRANPEEPAENEEARHNRQVEAPGITRSEIVNAVRKRDGVVALIAAVDTVRQCPFCGQVDNWDKKSSQRPPCSRCKRTWDSADGTCRVLLQRYKAKRVNGENAAVLKEKTETNYARRTRNRAAKQLRMQRAAR